MDDGRRGGGPRIAIAVCMFVRALELGSALLRM